MSETTHPSSYISISWNVETKYGNERVTRTASDPATLIEVLCAENLWGVYTPQETCNRYYYQAGLDADGRDVTPMEAIQALADADFIRIEHNGLDCPDK